MKYVDFKIFKFSTVLKKINRIKDSFLRFYKNIDDIPKRISHICKYFIKNMFSIIYKGTNLIIRNLLKASKRLLIKYFSYSNIYKYFNFKKLSINTIYKKRNIFDYKNITFYLIIFLTFSSFFYLMVPFFYDYNKSEIERVLCSEQNIKCSIKGKIKYTFLPTPRIIIKNIVVKDSINKKNTFAKIENTTIKLKITNLLNTKKNNFKKIELKNLQVNLNLNSLKKYKEFYKNQKSFIPLSIKKAEIKLLDDSSYVAAITDANMNLSFDGSAIEAVLKGKFLEDNIYISYDNDIKEDIPSSNITFKMSNLNLLTKINLFNATKEKNVINGKILIKKNKNKLTAIFDYKDNEVIIKKSSIRNVFLDGKLGGNIKFLPYFDFNIDLNLNSINFARLYSFLSTLNTENKKNLFKINKKINGNLNLSTEKIYAKYNLINSFESRVKFNNGDILIEQMLINLGKLGAADLLGSIKNNKNNINLKFESNLYIDNKKKFLNKFGVNNKLKISPNLFISGNFDLVNLQVSLYEIYDDKKFNKEDIDYIENDFNNFMLEDGYLSLFNFLKLKEFIKLTIEEVN